MKEAKERAAVITGMGFCVPGAADADQLWNLLGQGIGDTAPRRVTEDLGPSGGRDRTILLAERAVERALADAGLSAPLGARCGCSLSSSKGGLLSLVRGLERQKESRDLPSDFIENVFHGGLGGALCSRFGIEGPTANPVAACATGIGSLALARRWIAEGRCEMVIAGSSEAALHPFILAGFNRLGVLSRTRPAPLDQDRDGFVPGEGSAAFVVESMEHAQRRGAVMRARIAGTTVLGDAVHETGLDSSGATIVRAGERVMGEAVRSADTISAVSLHATGTRAGDPVEMRAMRSLFRTRREPLPLCASKGATGHLLGAAGSLEAAIAVLMIERSHVPPTANLNRLDPECAGGEHLAFFADYHPMPLESVLSFSYGFGGHVGAVLLERL